MKLNRDEFLETGYLIVKEAVPRDKLERVRQAYETLVNRQRENWKAERAAGDPPGGVWGDRGAAAPATVKGAARQSDRPEDRAGGRGVAGGEHPRS